MSAERCSDSGSGVGLITPVSGGWSHGTRNMDGNGASTDGWRDLASSTTVLFPGFASNPCSGKSVLDEPRDGGSVHEDNCKSDDNNSEMNSEKLERRENGFSSAMSSDNSGIKPGGSIAERRAAKFGFDASKINTCSFRASSALTSAVCRSPCLLRTPGISPSALLESPIMLPNLQPSPTTGAFGLPYLACESGIINSALPNEAKDKDSYDASSFTFKPHGNSVSFPGYSTLQNQNPPGTWALRGVEVELQHSAATHPPVTGSFEFPTQLLSQTIVNCSEFSSRPDAVGSSDTLKATDFHLSHSVGDVGVRTQQKECQSGEDTGTDHPLDVDQKVLDSSGGTYSTSEDGYNWRKYGQKQVKGSEFPRSYYKCTSPNCPVKKKVEHSHDGQIAEIVYQGTHNHPMPHPNRRAAFSSSALKVDDAGGSFSGEGGTVCRDLHHAYDDPKLESNWRPDGLERTSSTSFSTEFSDPPTINEAKSMDASESAETPELTSKLASNEAEDEEDATQGKMLVAGDNDNDNEPETKKRKMEEHPLIETTLASRAIREPRVIVQIESEVDVLDDGYRWRKYGQKVVKGNPNPRSYYKCTYPGCTVRKHVERASHNLKCVLTTYEGKHNHEVPSAKNSSHTSSVGGNSALSLPNPHGSLVLPLNSYLPKSEPQDPAAYSNRKLEYNSNFLRPNYLGKFDGGAASSIYQMKFPALPNTMLYGAAFGVNLNPDSSTMAQPNPGFSIPYPLGVSTSPNLSIPSNIQGRSLGTVNLSTWDSDQKRAT